MKTKLELGLAMRNISNLGLNTERTLNVTATNTDQVGNLRFQGPIPRDKLPDLVSF